MLDTFIALSFAAALLTIGFVFINFLPFLKCLQLPVSIVAGLLGLLFAHIAIGHFDLGINLGVNSKGIFPEK